MSLSLGEQSHDPARCDRGGRPHTGPCREPERPLLTPAEVAFRFRVDPKTVRRWGREGRLASIRTPGGHRRYYEDEVDALLNGDASAPRA
jgi:excisionase family DNA binding protein